jgi:hypothetical protein
MMLTIFQKARTVVAWLGEADKASNLSPWTTRKHVVLLCLFEHAWFQRTWIRQEVFAARKLTMQHSHRCIDFHELMKHAMRLGLVSNVLSSWISSLQNIYQSTALNCNGSLTLHFHNVLREDSLFGCTNNRDRIYGALGMVEGLKTGADAPRPERLPFPIDHTNKIAEVYSDVTRYPIEQTGSLNCLHLFGPRKHSRAFLPVLSTGRNTTIAIQLFGSSTEGLGWRA